MKFLSLIFLIILVSVHSCTNDKHFCIISPEKAINREITLSEISTSLTYVPLDNTVLFKHINKMLITSEFIFISGYPIGLVRYDINGTFRNQIGKVGNGPGEYRYGNKFSVDTQNSLIYILDMDEILVYDFDGKFIRSIQLEGINTRLDDIVYANSMLFISEGISMGFGEFDWLVLDVSGKIISKKYNRIPQFTSRWGGHGRMFKFKRDVYYFNSYNDTIFKISDATFNPAYLFSNGDFRRPRHDTENLFNYYDPLTFCMSEKYLFQWYYFNKSFHTGIYDKKKGELYSVNNLKDSENGGWHSPGIINDIDGGWPFPPLISFLKDDSEFLSGWIFAHEFTSSTNSKWYHNPNSGLTEKKKILKELVMKVDENDNPIIMIVKLKD